MCPSAPSAWGVQNDVKQMAKTLLQEKWLHWKLENFMQWSRLLRCFCPDVLMLQREITKMIYSSGRIHSRKFWAPQPYVLGTPTICMTFAWWPEPEIWLVVSNAPPRREPSRWDLHLRDQRLQMAWRLTAADDVKNLNRWLKAYWTEKYYARGLETISAMRLYIQNIWNICIYTFG